jgi:hypothetical protein
MPKYVRPKPEVLGWIVAASLLAGLLVSLWFALTSHTLVSLGIGVLLAAFFWWSHFDHKRKVAVVRNIGALRHGESICEFARAFDARSVDTWVIRAAYEQLQHHLEHIAPQFPVRSSDRLSEDLLIDDEELDMELALELEQRTHRSLKDTSSNSYLGKVRTVADLVHFFNAQPAPNAP